MNEKTPGRRDALARGALLGLGIAIVLAVPVGAVAATSALHFENEPGQPIGDAGLSAKVVQSNDDDELERVSGPDPLDDSEHEDDSDGDDSGDSDGGDSGEGDSGEGDSDGGDDGDGSGGSGGSDGSDDDEHDDDSGGEDD